MKIKTKRMVRHRIFNEKHFLVLPAQTFELNDLGLEIWKLIRLANCTEDDIVNVISQIYDVNVEEIRTDINVFLQELESIGAIEWER